MRLLGLAQDDTRVPVTGSAASAKFLFDALGRRHELVDRRAVDLTPLQRHLLAAASFHPNRERWRTRFNWGGRVAVALRSRNSGRAVRQVHRPFDIAVQAFGLFHTRGAPYVIYTDNTVELSRRHWPAWVDVDGRALERIYDWERDLYRGSLHAFTMGEAPAQSLVSFYGVQEERVSVVGGGATFETLPERSAHEREPVILFVGSDWTRKGGDVLLEAFRGVRASRPDARLQIVGTDEPGEEPGVEVLGFVGDRQRVADVYAHASIYCLPSRFEPYGLSVTEAMAYELPCVVSRVGGLTDIVLDGETGLVVTPEDASALAAALLRLLEDRDYATRLGGNGRARVEHHQNWDAVVERMQPGLELAADRLSGARPVRGGRFRRGRRAAEPISRR
jgi:glycosyltransferase involved in cell wall biosynthesis